MFEVIVDSGVGFDHRMYFSFDPEHQDVLDAGKIYVKGQEDQPMAQNFTTRLENKKYRLRRMTFFAKNPDLGGVIRIQGN